MDGLVCAQSESGAVEDVGSGASPDVRFGQLCLGVGDDGCEVSWDLAADADDHSASGEVATVNGEDTSGELAVGVEPFRLVLADGQRVAVFGVGYAVEPRGVAECHRVVPADGNAGESPAAKDGFGEDPGAFVLNGGWCRPCGGVVAVVVPGAVNELVCARS